MSRALTLSLLLCILMVSIPHAAHLPPWLSGLCATLLLWRAYLAQSGRAPPKRALLMSITLTTLGGVMIEFHTLFGREVGVALLVLLATLKLMELKTRRDAMALIYLCCFISITNFFYSQSPATALYMLAVLFALATAWVHVHAPAIEPRARIKVASTLLMQAIPLTLILFVLFPRVQGPLWGMPQDAYTTTGIDDKMSPGSFGKLSLSDAVAFRASFTGAVPRRDQMYWRGPVLWQFDGKTWVKGRTVQTRQPVLEKTSEPVEYTVTLEPHSKHWLFALDMPDKVSAPAEFTNDFQVLSTNTVNARMRYQTHSYLSYRANVDETDAQLIRALQLPANLNPKARQLAQSWQNGNDLQVVSRALGYFNGQKFYYTLNPPGLGDNGIDDFLFSTRQGFCEHYASSFVFLMRAAGIPARVVTGYQGGEYNAIGDYYIVRQSDAHAWAEVWIKKAGWLRIDPTAAVAPERVEKGLAAALPDNAALPFIQRNPPKWLRELSQNWDAMSYQWNQWVIGYDTERQLATLSRIGIDVLNWQQLGIYLAATLASVIGLFALLMLKHMIRQEPDKAQAAWLKFCKNMGKAGLSRPAHEGPLDYARRTAAMRPDLARDLTDLVNRYCALRYGGSKNEVELREFIRLADRTGRNAIMRH